MDDKTLDEIRARAETATPNKWAVADYREDIASLISEVRRLREFLREFETQTNKCHICEAKLVYAPDGEMSLTHRESCHAFTPEGEFK